MVSHILHMLDNVFINSIYLGSVDMMMDNNEDYLSEEMDKQKRKLRDIGSVLENQHQLLRLIIQVSEWNKLETISLV